MEWLQHVAPILVALGGLIKIYLDSRNANKTILDKLTTIQAVLDKHSGQLTFLEKMATENRDGIRHTQRYRLQYDINKAILAGYTTPHDFEELAVLYASYKKLEGNGAMDKLWERYEKLEMKEGN